MSTTTHIEYPANLDILQNVNQPAYALLSAAEKIYDINIDNRTISNQNIVVVEKDHKSKTIYFSVDRFVDYMDLAQTHCIIQYNAGGRTHFYPVPYYDIYTKSSEGKIIFPWNLSYNLTKNSGAIPFSVRFFRLGTFLTKDNNAELILTYNLNTLPSYIRVEKALTELQIDKNDQSYLQSGDKEILMSYVDSRVAGLSRKIYWTIVEDNFVDDTIVIVPELQKDISDIIEQSEKNKEENSSPEE